MPACPIWAIVGIGKKKVADSPNMTVIAEKKTALPTVATVTATASSTGRFASSSRKRETMNSE